MGSPLLTHIPISLATTSGAERIDSSISLPSAIGLWLLFQSPSVCCKLSRSLLRCRDRGHLHIRCSRALSNEHRSNLKRALTFILATVAVLLAASCTPEQVAQFKTMTPGQQSAVLEHLAKAGTSGDISTNPTLVCIRRHESDRGPYPHKAGYRAENGRSSASGAYQFVDGTWRTMSARAGYGGYPRASSAPPYVQDAVAYYTIRNGGIGHWNGSGCGA